MKPQAQLAIIQAHFQAGELDQARIEMDKFLANSKIRTWLKRKENRRQLHELNAQITHAIATKITNQSKALFLAIPEHEFYKLKKEETPQQLRFINFFNNLNWRVQQEILFAGSLAQSVLCMERWVWIMQCCFDAGDYHSCFAIYSAFNSTAIYRLKNIQASLSQNAIQRMQEFRHIFCLDENYRNLQQHMENHQIVIPHLGIYKTRLERAKANAQINNGATSFEQLESVRNIVTTLRNMQQQHTEQLFDSQLAESYISIKYLTAAEVLALGKQHIEQSKELELNGTRTRPKTLLHGKYAVLLNPDPVAAATAPAHIWRKTWRRFKVFLEKNFDIFGKSSTIKSQNMRQIAAKLAQVEPTNGAMASFTNKATATTETSTPSDSPGAEYRSRQNSGSYVDGVNENDSEEAVCTLRIK